MSHKDKLKVVEHAKEELSKFFKRYDFLPHEIKNFCKCCRQYNYKGFGYKDAPEPLKLVADTMGRDSIDPIIRYGANFLDIIKTHREKAQYVEDRTELQKTAGDNKVWATSELNQLFPSKGWEVTCHKFNKPYVEKQTGSYNPSFIVDIPIGWGHRVYEESIATVRGGDRERFVMSARKKNYARLAKDGIVAYDCKVLKVHNDEATMEDAWVFKYETPTDMILATHKEFSRAESLLNRRIKDTVVGELIDF